MILFHECRMGISNDSNQEFNGLDRNEKHDSIKMRRYIQKNVMVNKYKAVPLLDGM